jgi:hypothetical protein
MGTSIARPTLPFSGFDRIVSTILQRHPRPLNSDLYEFFCVVFYVNRTKISKVLGDSLIKRIESILHIPDALRQSPLL